MWKATYKMKACALALASLLFLFVANAAPLDNSSTQPLHPTDLSNYRGTGFWSDPCSLDGFFVGAGAVFCSTANPSGCIAALGGLLKAIYIDNCFD